MAGMYRISLGLLCGAVLAPGRSLVAAQGPVPPPFELLQLRPGAPAWDILLRLREAESRYAQDSTWRDTYGDLRSQAEAEFGNNLAALAMADLGTPADSSAPVVADGIRGIDAFDHLLAVAETAHVLMVNERHHAAQDRLITLALLAPLWQRGYRYLAAETFDRADSGLVARGYPLAGHTGSYVVEPVFGEIVREALRLGYVLVPYESTPDQRRPLNDQDTRTSQVRRDSAQAANLVARTLAIDSGARILVHAGYAHINEGDTPTWKPMARFFRDLTGVNPVTVDQTVLSERSTPESEDPLYRAVLDLGVAKNGSVFLVDSDGAFLPRRRYSVDLQLVKPRTEYDTYGRPTWMQLGGRRAAIEFPVPECAAQFCMVEVRRVGEPDSAVVLDRAEATGHAAMSLYLPRGVELRIEVFDRAGAVIRRETRRLPPS